MFKGGENYFKSADNGHRLLTSELKNKYFQEVIEVLGKYDSNNYVYLKFIKQRKKHDRYAIKTIIKGFDYDELMNHLNCRNNLDSMVCICNTDEYLANSCQNKVSPVKTLEYLKNNFNGLKSNGLITSQKDFIMAPIYNGEPGAGHWTVAIISQGRIDMFDSTLQQENIFEIEKQLFSCDETINAGIPIQDKNGTICGLCSAEFIIEASQCKSLKHLKDNMDIICNNVATNVIMAIKSENVKGQLAESFQHNSKISPLRPIESIDRPEESTKGVINKLRAVKKSEPIRLLKRSFARTRTKTCQKWQTNNQQRPLPGKRVERKKSIQK